MKSLTTKPVVGVGRYTSPDAMVSAMRRGVLDLIGAARPSIADPLLPRKIDEGRADEIRECIGCNICVTGDSLGVPIRCTQNPTMGEEWRRGWHPERIAPAASSNRVLVVGAGPAGLELGRALGQRGYEVAIADANEQFGGRLLHESRLPGLSSWMRVADYRLNQLRQMPKVALYPGNRLTADEVLEFGFETRVRGHRLALAPRRTRPPAPPAHWSIRRCLASTRRTTCSPACVARGPGDRSTTTTTT